MKNPFASVGNFFKKTLPSGAKSFFTKTIPTAVGNMASAVKMGAGIAQKGLATVADTVKSNPAVFLPLSAGLAAATGGTTLGMLPAVLTAANGASAISNLGNKKKGNDLERSVTIAKAVPAVV